MLSPRLAPAAAADFLAGCLRSGEELLAAARMVGDHDDFDVWHRRRAYWIEETSQALVRLFAGQGALNGFRQAVSAPAQPGGWQQDMTFQIAHTRAGLDRVRALLKEIELDDAASA